MATEFHPGAEVQRGDLCVFFQDACKVRTNVYEIYYALYYVDPGPPETEVLIGDPQRTPDNPEVGEYYAALFIPTDAIVGTYRIRWHFKEANDSSPATEIVQEFEVVTKEMTVGCQYSQCVRELLRRLRIHLRDQNPDKFYHFRPPEHEGRIGQFNRVFGQIWEDEELIVYLETALMDWNAKPPETEGLCSLDALCAKKPVWAGYIMTRAMFYALYALAINWVADEFDYSIGGITLAIDKSSKYEQMKQNAKAEWDQAVETKLMTTKLVRGLAQPRFGIGIRSAFGPHTGRGVLSPRNFM